MFPELSFLSASDASFLAKTLQVCGMSSLLFIVWFLQRKSEDKRMTLIMKAEEKKWTQKFQEEREERKAKFAEENSARQQQFDLQKEFFSHMLENLQMNSGQLNTAIALLNSHPRMFDDICERLDLNTAALGKIHSRLDQALLEKALSHRTNPIKDLVE